MTIWQPSLEERSGPRYLAIADAIARDVSEGRLAVGDRMPTHRELADRLGVTVGTITRGYAEAARRGLLTGEIGRGTFVRARSPEVFPFRRAGEAAVVDLGLNVPPPPEGIDEAALLQSTLLDVARRDLRGLLDYPVDGGSAPHRDAGAAWVARAGLDVPAERVLVCGGSQHALTAVFSSLLKPGDGVATEALTYPGAKAVATLLHLRLVGLPMDDEGLQPGSFEAACRGGAVQALYLVPTIQNPTAAMMSAERRQQIASIARAHDVLVIEDDIHALLPRERPEPLAAHAPAHACYLTSTSKMIAPGLRIAYLVAPPDAVPRLEGAIRATTWGAAPLMAEIAAAWIRSGTAWTVLEARRREAEARQRLALEILPRARVRTHPSAYYLWLSLPEPWRSERFAAELRARGVVVMPAEMFAVGRASAPSAVRVSLGAPADRAELERGLRVVAGMLTDMQQAAPTVL